MHRYYFMRSQWLLLVLCMLAECARAQAPPLVMSSAVDCQTGTPVQPLTEQVALARMRRCNRDLIAARRAVIAARADQRIAGQAPNPTLTVGVGSINPMLGIGTGTLRDKTVDTSARYEQLIERGGKLALRQQGAQLQVAATGQDLAEMERQQGAAVLQAMVDLAAADGRVSLLTEVVALYDETLRANARRTARGDLAPIDAQRQAIDATRAQADLRQAQADLQRARLALGALLAWEIQVRALQVDPVILDVTPVASDAFDPVQRADVRAARLRTDAAQAARDLARAQAKPDVTVGLQLDHWPTSATNTTGTGNTISFIVSIPLLVRHSFDGELARALSDSDAAQEAFQRVQAAAQSDWVRINADLASSQARLQLLQTQQTPQAEQVAGAAELGYAKGALSVMELLDARRVLRQTRLDVLAARADLARATLTRNRWIASQTE